MDDQHQKHQRNDLWGRMASCGGLETRPLRLYPGYPLGRAQLANLPHNCAQAAHAPGRWTSAGRMTWPMGSCSSAFWGQAREMEQRLQFTHLS
jgi:hypothetical protein